MRGARSTLISISGLALGLATTAHAQPATPPGTVEPGTDRIAAEVPRSAPDTASAERTVTLVAPADHPTLPVIRAELGALGLTLREGRPDDVPGDSRFRVVLADGKIEVWARERGTHRTVLREVFTQADSSPVAQLTAVLQAVELIRTQLDAPAPKPVPPPEPPPPPPPAPPEKRSGWLLSTVATLVYSPGGTTVGAGAELDVVRYWSQIGIRGFAATAWLPNRKVASEGTAEATPRFAGVQGVWIADRGRAGIAANAGAGVALVGTRLTASADAGYRAAEDHLFTVAPIVDLRVGAPLGARVALVATAAVLIPLRSDRILFGDRQVARHGEAIVTGGAGLQLELP